MSNDKETQALECGSGSKDWLDINAAQQLGSEKNAEVRLHKSLDGVVAEGAAQQTVDLRRLKILESTCQKQKVTTTKKCDTGATAGFGPSSTSAKNSLVISQHLIQKGVLHDMSDCSLRKTQGPNLEIPSRTEAVAPNLRFCQISNDEATELIVKYHYLHRKCPISLAYGIKVGEETKGVLTVGKLNSYSACVGVTGGTLMDVKLDKGRWRDVFELNRLWVSDDLPPNTESRFIGWVLRELKRDYPNLILLSYADGEQNHVGYVYQATNWIYTGLSTKFADRTLAGYNDHRSVPKGKLQGPNVIRKQRSRKHRYVMFLTPKDEGLLAWERLPYPKRAAR